MKAAVAALALAVIFASGGYVELPEGPVYIEDAGVYVNVSGGVYFVKTWEEGARLAVLSKPVPVPSKARVEGGMATLELGVGGCRLSWASGGGGASPRVYLSTGDSGTLVAVEVAESWASATLECGGVEVAILAGPPGETVQRELTPVYTLPGPPSVTVAGGPGGLREAAGLAALVSLAVSVVAWIVERRGGGGG